MIEERHALMTCDREHEDVVGPLYYFKLYDRMPGPYKTQIHRKAIIDVAADGTLAGVELIDDMPPPPRPADPPSSLIELFGERCTDYDPDCATCFAHKQAETISSLKKIIEASVSNIAKLHEENRTARMDRGAAVAEVARLSNELAQAYERCAKIAETCYIKDNFRFELGTQCAAAIRDIGKSHD